jgi:hypothetical protein
VPTRPRALDHIVVAVPSLDAVAATYEGLGFRLTPRARHPDNMGTSNRLVQFAARNFIELLEVDRPLGLDEHALGATPPRYSFGAQNRDFLRRRQGLSLLVLASEDARADLADWQARGLRTYAPFDFERRAKLPDGQEVTVAFTLGFVTDPGLPALGFFVCQNRFPQYFWKPAFQSHANGAKGIVALYLAAGEPARHAGFLTALTGGEAREVPGGLGIALTGGCELQVLTPAGIAAIAPGKALDLTEGPLFAGIALAAAKPSAALTPAAAAGGIFIEWRSAS